MKHNKVLHEENVILNVVTADTPRVDEEHRTAVERLSDGFLRVTLTQYPAAKIEVEEKGLTLCTSQPPVVARLMPVHKSLE